MTLRLRLLLWYMNHLAKPNDYDKISPQQVRQQNRKELATIGWLIDGRATPMSAVTDLSIPVRDGASIAIRHYKPNTQLSAMAILFFHGGGFVTRDIDSHDKVCRRLAQATKAQVFSVGYRLAPEYKFPIPVEDCEDAFHWLSKQEEIYNFNKQKIVLIGDSAGANLATVVSRRSRGVDTPKPWRQILIYPVTDARMQHSSIKRLGKNYFLTQRQIRWYTDNYKQTNEDVLHPDMSPLLAKDLSDQPPTYLCTAALDPLLDEGKEYAQRLKQAGVKITYREFPEVIHGFLNMPRIMPDACKLLYEDMSNFLAVQSK